MTTRWRAARTGACRTQIGNEFGTGQRLEDVVGGHRQEGVGNISTAMAPSVPQENDLTEKPTDPVDPW